ncbi:SAV_6107 family HEPN domain-containing protein [Frankia sp. Ag45/Mut15]|uniref:SAV_6107 family HEPN domain-containing protein n=1 Tax=Frankia umida TaxID=573489 RepID=A0ABT0JWY9_9ACTN|nr:SAV_6107 family HEPN domain-containing protein [Frankia umida]MCK9876065.1 SAV_6107 family HEPN domain-containing protein [Frankia umida]
MSTPHGDPRGNPGGVSGRSFGAGPGGEGVRAQAVRAAASPAGGAPERALLPAAGLPHRSRDELLAAARHGLDEAEYATCIPQRYAQAHLAALRAAAAVLADRARPRPGRRGRPLSAWCLLVRVAPELAEWADFFAAGARRRAAAEAGLNVVGRREADDLIRQVHLFLGAVEQELGLPSQPVLAGSGPAARA